MGTTGQDETIVSAINEICLQRRRDLSELGEPTGHQWEGKYIQLSRSVLGVETRKWIDS
ncbi:MAG: hypothetical protein ACLTKE_06710 [Coprococcus sp.]